MAYFCELDNDNIVTRVVVTDDEMPNKGHDWLVTTFGGNWIETSYDGSFRANYASTGWLYDEAKDVFIAPQPYPSWTLDTNTYQWIPPYPRPEDVARDWDEDSLSWVEVTE